VRYRLQKDAFSDDDFAKIRAGVLDSKWVGQNPLDGTFSKTRGFGVVFRKDGQAELKARLPYVGAFLEKAIAIYDDKSWSDKIAALLKAASVQPQEVNAFYLNAFESSVSGDCCERVSLVLEAYALDESALAHLPKMRVQSRQGFAAHLRTPGA